MARVTTAPNPTKQKTARLGELAVQMGMVSQEHLDLCVEYQRELHRAPGAPHQRLGEILVRRKLLTPEQVDRLLAVQKKLQSGEGVASAAPEAGRPPASRGGRWNPFRLRPGLISCEFGAAHVLIIAILVPSVVLYALSSRPGPSHRSLVRYLESCSEDSVEPDETLAVRKLRLLVRGFEIGRFDPVITHDYAAELRVLAARRAPSDWTKAAWSISMPEVKRSALLLAAPMLPERLTPANAERLTIRTQAAACRATLKPYGGKAFTTGACRFLMIRVESPRWDSGWRVADYSPIGQPHQDLLASR
jgi:hypothetical protein